MTYDFGNERMLKASSVQRGRTKSEGQRTLLLTSELSGVVCDEPPIAGLSGECSHKGSLFESGKLKYRD